MEQTRIRLVAAGLLAAMALGTIGGPVQAGTSACRVRNVTQGTHGRSFNRVIGLARDGDRLQVRGTCAAHATIEADVVIVGVGRARPVLTGMDRQGVLAIAKRADVILINLVITAGHEHPERFGGGISNEGELLVLDSVIRNNENLGSGGIENRGRMTLRDSVVRRNLAASGDGGGIRNRGTLTVLDSVIEGNRAFWDGYDVYPSGGGIANRGTLTVRRSIIRGNTASVHGGGVYNTGDLTLARSRVVGNTASTGGGVSNNWGGTAVLRASRVAQNLASDVGGGIWNGYWSPWDEVQPKGATSSVSLIGSTVQRNRADSGGGIWTDDAPGGGDTSVTLDAASSVSDNAPDDCVGTAAC